jgi:hypothetical protein
MDDQTSPRGVKNNLTAAQRLEIAKEDLTQARSRLSEAIADLETANRRVGYTERLLTDALAALRELVALKDGPRDADYDERKPLAWQRARDLLQDAIVRDDDTEHPDQNQSE